MRTLKGLIGAGLLAATLVGCVDQRTGVTQNELPEPVAATLEQNARPGKVKSIIRETSDKRVIYKAQVTNEGQTWEIGVRGDGELLYKKEK